MYPCTRLKHFFFKNIQQILLLLESLKGKVSMRENCKVEVLGNPFFPVFEDTPRIFCLAPVWGRINVTNSLSKSIIILIGKIE